MNDSPSEPAGPPDDLRITTGRLEAFSDGVFAIAITLLVLEIGVDTAEKDRLLRALLDLWPNYLAYLTSFLTVGLVWLGHHAMLSSMTHVDSVLLRINLLLLLVVSFLPFPTQLMGDFIREEGAERVAAVFYGTWLLIIAVTIAVMWRYASYGRRLLDPRTTQSRIDQLTRRLEPNIGFYVVAIAIALLLPRLGAALFLVISIVGFLRTS